MRLSLRATGLFALAAAVLSASADSSAQCCRRPLADCGRTAAWTRENGESATVRGMEGGVELSFAPSRDSWANVSHPLTLPTNAVAIVWEEKTLRLDSPGFRLLWLHETDGDIWRASVPRGKAGEWREVVVPVENLVFMDRGNKKRQLQTVNRLAMGLHNAPMSVQIRNLAVIVRNPERKAAHLRLPPPDPKRRTVILDCGKEKPHALRVLSKLEFGVRTVSPEALADPGQFSKANADLLVIPCSPFFPADAADNFKRFLKDGGAFFAFGGYAFDKMADSPDAPDGLDFSRLQTASEVNFGKAVASRLNSRYGKTGDTITYPKDVIAVFDPSFLVRHADRIVASPDQSLAPAGSSFPLPNGTNDWVAAVAMTGNGDPVFPTVYARYIPVLEAKDRFGRSRGPVLSLVFNHDGPYAKSAWAFCGHSELFEKADPDADRLFVEVCRRLLSPVCLAAFQSDKTSVHPGESVEMSVRMQGSAPGAVCRFLIGGDEISRVALSDGVACCRFSPRANQASDKGIVEVRAELVVGGKTVDCRRTGVVLLGGRRGPAFCFADNMFSIDGRRRFFGGMNTTGMIWHSANEDPLVWERDFSDMADYGMKFLRLLHFSPFAQDRKGKSINDPKFLVVPPLEKTVRQTDALTEIAAANGVGVFLTLHDWMPWELEPEELRPQEDWARFWADRYRSNPGVFYDIQNEPDPNRWKKFSEGKSWRDLGARDGERKRAAYFARWQKANGDAVHQGCPQAAVTVGNLQTLDAVEKQLSTDGLDFLNVHHYGSAADLRSVVKLIDRRFEGKGFSLGEFGATVAHDARGRGKTGDPSEDSIRHFLHVNHYLYAMGGAFTGVWDWKEFQDCVFPHGVTWQDGTPKPVLKAYRNVCLLLGEAGATVEHPVLWLILPDSFRLGGDSGRIHRAVQSAADALLCLNVPFGVINEEALGRLPASAKALVWPLAVCPTDEAFARVAGFVKKGGALLVTGDFRHDADRHPTRKDRLAELGLSADFDVLDPMRGQVPASAGVRTAGRMTWSPQAVELTGARSEVRGLYRKFLDEVARVPRLSVPGNDEGAVARFRSTLEDGGSCETAINTTDEVLSFGKLTLSPYAVFWRRRSESGAVTSIALAGEVPGLSVKGAPCAILSLDGKDVFESAAFAVLPYGPCEINFRRKGVSVRGEIGEFRGRRWHRLGNAEGLSVPDDGTAQDIRIFATSEGRAAAVSALEKLL